MTIYSFDDLSAKPGTLLNADVRTPSFCGLCKIEMRLIKITLYQEIFKCPDCGRKYIQTVNNEFKSDSEWDKLLKLCNEK